VIQIHEISTFCFLFKLNGDIFIVEAEAASEKFGILFKNGGASKWIRRP
jgi:hypothetical protein